MSTTGGKSYADLVAAYLMQNFGERGIVVYREVPVGKSIIGKNRRVDVLVLHAPSNRAFAVECKYQETSGTADEKIPYALDDLRALRMPGCLVYAGAGFSEGVLHMLRGSDLAAFCDPNPEDLRSTPRTWELDHMLAMALGFWDVLVRGRRPFDPSEVRPTRTLFDT